MAIQSRYFAEKAASTAGAFGSFGSSFSRYAVPMIPTMQTPCMMEIAHNFETRNPFLRIIAQGAPSPFEVVAVTAYGASYSSPIASARISGGPPLLGCRRPALHGCSPQQYKFGTAPNHWKNRANRDNSRKAICPGDRVLPAGRERRTPEAGSAAAGQVTKRKLNRRMASGCSTGG